MKIASSIRVQSGSLRGRVIEQPKTPGTRPTKSIVKDCVFNVLRGELAGAEFIEAFGGSASMAIEAISNGAASASVCELGAEALACARRNCRGLDICVLQGDAFELVGGLVEAAKARGQWVVVYLDPPFACRKGFSGVYERLDGICKGADVVVVEHQSDSEIELDGFTRESVRKFGKTSVSFFRDMRALERDALID